MINIIYVDNYAKLVFQHTNGNATIYLELPLDVPLFQIEIIKKFFNRMMFFCAVETYIDIIIERLKDNEVFIIAYFYNKNQNYDLCGTFEKPFFAFHKALTELFDLSITNQHAYASIDIGYRIPIINEYDEDEDEEYYNQLLMDDQDEEIEPPKKEVNERFTKTGQSIDAILKQFDQHFKTLDQD